MCAGVLTVPAEEKYGVKKPLMLVSNFYPFSLNRQLALLGACSDNPGKTPSTDIGLNY
jgi:hypothetical protein